MKSEKTKKHPWEWVLDLIYPHCCPFCQKVTRQEVCGDCLEKIVEICEPRCKKCGKPIRDEQKEYCGDCERHMPDFEEGRSLWLHRDPVSAAVYRFKYQNQRCYGRYFAAEFYRRFFRELKEWEIEVIIPVPLYWKKYRARGYNQAEILARELGKLSGIPVRTDLVLRTGYTVPQKELGPVERRKNLRKAFEVSEEIQACRNVLLIDDIHTTGATIGTIARKMKQKGTGKVYFFTISIGQGF